MVKAAFIAGVALTLAGVAAGFWPVESVTERSRRLVPKRTFDRRGPTVVVHEGAARVRNATREALSVTMVLSADGYWVRARPGFLTRERLRDAKVLVVDRAWDTIGDWRTSTLVSRWVQEGGSLLMLAGGEGPEVRRQLGTGRIAVIDPTAFGTTDFVERLLSAMHWLSSEANLSPAK